MEQKNKCNITKKKYAVWGCGEYSSYMMKQLKLITNNIPIQYYDLVPQIEFFIDKDPKKQGGILDGIMIISPEAYIKQMCEGLVLCVKNPQILDEERDWLIANGQENILTFDSFFRMIYDEISVYASSILNESSRRDEGILARLYIEEILKNSGKLTKEVVEKLIKSIGVSAFVAGIRYKYWDKIVTLEQECLEWRFIAKREVKTVGLISAQLSAGGAERVVSILSTILTDAGIKVVLINDHIGEQEYTYSKEADRVIVENRFIENPFIYFKQLESVVNDKKIDLVCFHTPYEGVEYFYRVLFYSCLGIEVITESHTSVHNMFRRGGKLDEIIPAYKMNKYIVTLSSQDESFWKDKGIIAKYIPNPVSRELRMPFIERSNHCKRLLWVGRISQKEKNIYDAIKIFCRLYTVDKEYSLSIVGSCTNRNDLQHVYELIELNGLKTAVNIEGWKNDMSEYYCNSDILLMTSPGEGFSLVLLEAKAYSLPVVMYELPYLELVKNNLGIVAVSQGDIEGASDKIRQVLGNEKEYRMMNRQAWESIQEFFSRDIGIDWLNIIK